MTADRSLLRDNDQFRWLVVARVVSFAGDQLTVVALTLLVHARHGAGPAVSALLVAQAVPHLFGPLVGAVVDRHDQRRVLQACEALRAGVVTAVALTLPPLGVLVGLVAVNAVLASALRPAGRSAIPALVEPARLGAANATLATGANLGFALGPALGGLLVASVGVPGALLADVATSVLALGLLGRLHPLPPEGAPASAPQGLLADTREGLRFVLGERTTRTLAVSLFAGVALAGVVLVGGVFLVRDELAGGPAAYGLFTGSWGLGMIAVSVLLTRSRRSTPASLWLVLGFASQAAALIGAGLAPHVAVAVGVAALGGAGNALEDIATDTILQQVVPRRLLGRAVGAVYAGSFAGGLVAYAAAGPLVDLVGPRGLLVGAGAGLVLVTVWVAAVMPFVRSGRQDARRWRSRRRARLLRRRRRGRTPRRW